MSRPSSEQNLVSGLSNLVQTLSNPEPNLDLVLKQAQAMVDALEIAAPPLSLSFFEGAAFRDRVWIESTPALYNHALKLTKYFEGRSSYGVRFRNVPSIESVLTLAKNLASAYSDHQEERVTDDIHLLPIEAESETTTYEIALAFDAIDGLRSHPWDWNICLKVIRHLENALLSDANLALRALTQLEPFEEWDVSRRALVAAFHLMALLHRVQSPQEDRRAAGHSALLISLAGLEDRGGHELSHAATHALKAVIEHSVPTQLALEPHRLRVCALCSALMPQGVEHSLAAPLALVYELERLRCPANVSIALDEVDLMVLMLDQSFTQNIYGPALRVWTHILLQTLGTLPPGTSVGLNETTGVVVRSSETHMRPEVSVEGSVINAKSEVELLEPLARWQSKAEPPALNLD